MAEYIKREDVYGAISGILFEISTDVQFALNSVAKEVERIPTADVVERDEGIRMGAELAAMHGSDATSQELEKAYLDGVAEGLRNARKRGMWIGMRPNWYVCSECHNSLYSKNPPPYCSACGADMRGDDDV